MAASVPPLRAATPGDAVGPDPGGRSPASRDAGRCDAGCWDPTGRTGLPACILAALLLLWPAIWNGYPIVFADTGTYLSQAIHHYAGWDRPVFYSLFILPLHLTLSLWPVVAAQALLAACVLRLVCRTLVPRIPDWAFLATTAALSTATWLPWLVSEVMPDLLTPLLVLLIGLLGFAPNARHVRLLALLSAAMIATAQSSLALSLVLGGLVAGLRLPRFARLFIPAQAMPRLRHVAARLLLPPVLALIGLCAVNLAAHGRFAPSPYGNIFLLARLIADGPALAALRQDCPTHRWRLCPFLGAMPADSDVFLWTQDSPLNQAGGPKAVSAEASEIIRTAILADPAGTAAAALRNTLAQSVAFASGDGLQAWTAQVLPWIQRDFPAAEGRRFEAARQQSDALRVPFPFGLLHQAAGVAGVIACIALLPAAIRRRDMAAGFLALALATLPVSAAITGALSGPHDRYQARIMWLPPLIAALSAARLRR